MSLNQYPQRQALLGAMNQRQGLQLKPQAIVEGLSVAAITCYISGLVYYLARGAGTVGWPLTAETTTAMAVPVVALVVWLLLRRLHNKVIET